MELFGISASIKILVFHRNNTDIEKYVFLLYSIFQTFLKLVFEALKMIIPVTESMETFGSFCDSDVFKADCPTGHVILLTHALFGRMRVSKCVRVDYGHVGCAVDVMWLLDARCSGRRSCQIAVPDAELAKEDVCPRDLKSYLEVAYRCVRSGWYLRFFLVWLCAFVSVRLFLCGVLELSGGRV